MVRLADRDGIGVSRPLPPALLDVVVELANDAVIAVDADARVVTWGRVAGRYFGYTADEIVDAPVLTLVAETMHPDVGAVIERMLAGELVRRYETVARRKDGMPLPISLSGCTVAVAGSAIAAVLVLRDLTEQRLAQAALAEVEARLRESEALAGVGSWLWDVGSGVVQWSDEAHRLHGVDPLAFDGTLASHLRAIHRDDRDRVRAAMESAVSSTTAVRRGVPHRTSRRHRAHDRTPGPSRLRPRPRVRSACAA